MEESSEVLVGHWQRWGGKDDVAKEGEGCLAYDRSKKIKRQQTTTKKA